MTGKEARTKRKVKRLRAGTTKRKDAVKDEPKVLGLSSSEGGLSKKKKMKKNNDEANGTGNNSHGENSWNGSKSKDEAYDSNTHGENSWNTYGRKNSWNTYGRKNSWNSWNGSSYDSWWQGGWKQEFVTSLVGDVERAIEEENAEEMRRYRSRILNRLNPSAPSPPVKKVWSETQHKLYGWDPDSNHTWWLPAEN